jgi:integral membrane protein
MLNNLINKYEEFTPFTKNEAWGIFRVAAFAEAAGWTLLILGILIKQFIIPNSDVPVILAGRVHGTLFLLYIVAVVAFSPSQGWSIKRTIVSGAASIPPYGSLMFEQWAAYKLDRLNLSRSLILTFYYSWAFAEQL